MPNIMFFGFILDQYLEAKPVIDKTMQGLGLGKSAVTTFVHSCVEGCEGKRTNQPYIRVFSTGGSREINRVVTALKKIKILKDCEILPLPRNGFIPAKAMTNS